MFVIVCRNGLGFPEGMAPTARVRAYAAGLLRAGRNVLVLCTTPSESVGMTPLNAVVGGAYEGIQFEYTCGGTTWAGNPLARRGQIVRGLAVAARRILARHRSHGDVDGVILYPDSAPSSIIFRLVASACGVPLVLEKSELPIVHRGDSLLAKCTLPLYVRLVYPLFDGIIVISDYLEEYFTRATNGKTAILQVPILVDPACVAELADCDYDPEGHRVLYTGGLSERKDGVGSLVSAFPTVLRDCPEALLVVVGPNDSADAVRWREFVQSRGLEDRIMFAGCMTRSAVFGELRRASVLVLPRPDSPQARAGMPTKLAEYLMSGRPVVLTRVGQQAKVLADGVSASFVEAGDSAALARAVVALLQDRDSADAMGRRGREVASREFDDVRHGKRIAAFVTGLRKGGGTTRE